MIQSCHLLDDRSSPDPFWTEVQGWYNPATFSMTEVTGSLLDICPRMIQSLFILEDRGLRITSGHMSQDDTIPLHSQWPRSLDHFRERAQGWYNPIATSLLPLSRKVFLNNTNLVSKVFELYSRQTLRQYIIYIFSMWILNYHHLYLQYVNTESIIIYIFSIEILKHHHMHLISYVEILDLYVLQRNTGFSQLWLLHRIIVVSIFRSKRPDISFRSHMASQLSRAIFYVFCSSRAKRNTGLFLAKPWTHSRPQTKAST